VCHNLSTAVENAHVYLQRTIFTTSGVGFLSLSANNWKRSVITAPRSCAVSAAAILPFQLLACSVGDCPAAIFEELYRHAETFRSERLEKRH
jgi:hypothetical protein